MNAARRQIISEFLHQGFGPKEAYEATKDPSVMRDWVRISVPQMREKKAKPETYRQHRRRLKELRALATLKLRNKEKSND